jgi:hypothetical protein
MRGEFEGSPLKYLTLLRVWAEQRESDAEQRRQRHSWPHFHRSSTAVAGHHPEIKGPVMSISDRRSEAISERRLGVETDGCATHAPRSDLAPRRNVTARRSGVTPHPSPLPEGEGIRFAYRRFSHATIECTCREVQKLEEGMGGVPPRSFLFGWGRSSAERCAANAASARSASSSDQRPSAWRWRSLLAILYDPLSFPTVSFGVEAQWTRSSWMS